MSTRLLTPCADVVRRGVLSDLIPHKDNSADFFLTAPPVILVPITNTQKNLRNATMGLRTFAVRLAFAVAGVVCATAEPYPTKPITLVGRICARRSDQLVGAHPRRAHEGHARPERGGRTSPAPPAHWPTTAVGRADPDGYTLYLGNWTVNVGAVTMFPVHFDALKDFEPVALLSTSKLWIVARKELPASTAKEFVAWLKANPGKANAASVGVGSAAHVCLVDFANRTGTTFQFVTYRGGAPAVQAAGGRARLTSVASRAARRFALYRSGKVKIIGVASPGPAFRPRPRCRRCAGGAARPPSSSTSTHGLWAAEEHAQGGDHKAQRRGRPWLSTTRVGQEALRAELGHTLPPPDQPHAAGAVRSPHKAEIEKWWPIMKAAGIKDGRS